MPAIAQRSKTMRAVHHCAHHWLHLSDRVVTRSKESRQSCRRRHLHRRVSVQQVNPYMKHELLEALRSQVSHINDVAAFVYHWVPRQNWRYPIRIPTGTGNLTEPEPWKRMDSLNKKIHEALSLVYQGYLDFSNKKKDPRNKVKEFSAFNTFQVQYFLVDNDQLLLLCTLHRLQQLNPEAVLARLQSIFSRCCRFDLLLASSVMCFIEDPDIARQAEYQASKQEVPAADILTAFSQAEPCIRQTVSQLTALQREAMTSCVQTMVNNHLVPVQADRHEHARPRCRQDS
ncbi:TPA: hypothetical protein ACH3X1_010805 [Trebouxia sp. C0004]